MEILAAYDLTGSYRKAAELAGCDHHTVRRYVQLRGTGIDPAARLPRAKKIDAFMPKIEELIEASHGRIGADQVHKKLVAMGFAGTDRTTRRAVAAAKESFKSGHRRIHRPWVTEPGLWMQWDWGEGPRLGDRRTSLWCAWLAWSRFQSSFANGSAVDIGRLATSCGGSATYFPAISSSPSIQSGWLAVPRRIDTARQPRLCRAHVWAQVRAR